MQQDDLLWGEAEKRVRIHCMQVLDYCPATKSSGVGQMEEKLMKIFKGILLTSIELNEQ